MTRSHADPRGDANDANGANGANVDVGALAAAVARRSTFAVPSQTNLRRLVDGDGDDLQGVVVDRYGPVVRVELWRKAWPTNLAALTRVFDDTQAVVAVLRTGAGQSETRVLRGQVDEAHVVVEDGMRLLVRVADDGAVGSGVFVDQRLGRRIVRDAARGRVVVNLFAHAGAFGVAAAVGGASRVDHVDMAKKCAPWAATNLALNGVFPRQHRFIVDDALLVLGRLAKKPGSAGVIVIDPPTQAVRTKKAGGRFVLEDSLFDLALQACTALEDGGLLLLSCNDRDVSAARVLECAERGARTANRAIFSLDELPLPDDITSATRGGRARPMRGAVLRLR